MTLPKVTYYTVHIEGRVEPEYVDFDKRMATESTYTANRLAEISTYLRVLGTRYAASAEAFRKQWIPPGRALAVPGYPDTRKKFGVVQPGLVRLYCERMSDSVVILFNGARKRALYAEDCPNCKPHIEMANKLQLAIARELARGSIALRPGELLGITNKTFQL